jgi:hypothetical protein
VLNKKPQRHRERRGRGGEDKRFIRQSLCGEVVVRHIDFDGLGDPLLFKKVGDLAPRNPSELMCRSTSSYIRQRRRLNNRHRRDK